MWLLIFVTVFVIIAFLYWKDKRTISTIEAKGVKYIEGGFLSFVLSTIKGFSLQDSLAKQYESIKRSGKKVGVATGMGITSVTLIDPEVIKSVLVKDFDHFADRQRLSLGQSDYLFQKMLVSLTGEKWKQLRSKMSPTFTTGKIKRMFKLFDQSGAKFVKFLENEIQRTGNAEIDLTEGYSKYTMDIIASAACGVDSKAFNQKEPSLFEQMGKGLQLQLGASTIFKFIIMIFLPTKISDFLGLSFFKKDVQDFFSEAIKGLIKRREATGEKGDDFVQLMLEARAGTLKTDESELDAFEKDAMLKVDSEKKSAMSVDLLDDTGIVANCVLFILAGFDTTQSLLLFCAYALALNQDIQDRLRSEVDSVLDDNNGQFTYDGMNQMTYLDMVINETLRFYPPAPSTDRSCTIDYKVPGTEYVLQKGGALALPTYSLHHDPEHYPDPEKFEPERFSPENKHKVNPYTFLAFGQGPRNCIGMRFALMEAKVVLSYLVHHFKIEPSEKTLIPMKYSNSSSLKPDGGMYLRLEKIKRKI